MCTVTPIDRASLRVLNVSCNPIGDDGISMMIEELQQSSALSELIVSACGLSMKGIMT